MEGETVGVTLGCRGGVIVEPTRVTVMHTAIASKSDALTLVIGQTGVLKAVLNSFWSGVG